jgi:hypothetical protein
VRTRQFSAGNRWLRCSRRQPLRLRSAFAKAPARQPSPRGRRRRTRYVLAVGVPSRSPSFGPRLEDPTRPCLTAYECGVKFAELLPVGPWRSWQRASMASRRSGVRIPPGPPAFAPKFGLRLGKPATITCACQVPRRPQRRRLSCQSFQRGGLPCETRLHLTKTPPRRLPIPFAH